MLGLFSTKSNHPLADPKEARVLLAELAASQAAAGLEEATSWCESVAADENLRLDRRIEILLQLDETAVLHARRTARDYLTSPRQGRTQEMRLWGVNHGYWATLCAAYESCQARAQAKEKGADALKSHQALLAARMLHAYAALLKWDQFRYGPIDPRLWASMGQVHLAAKAAKVSEKAVTLYTVGSIETTPEREYLKALAFHSSSMDKLLPLEIEIAERLIAHFLPGFVFTDQARPDNVYWCDSAKPLPPTRLARLPEISPTLCFFSSGAALGAAEALRQQIDETKEVPASLVLGGQYPPRVVLPVLTHLIACWAPRPPMRTHARHHVKSRLAVVHGIAGVHQRIAGVEGDFPDTESWVVDDVSIGGMGTQVPLGPNDWICIGSLLAIQPEGGNNWLVGIVRRFSRVSDKIGAVGLETVGRTPRAIVADSGGLKTDAILLESTLSLGGLARVILPTAAWEDFIPMVFEAEGKTIRLQPREILETGAEFVVGSYRVEAIA